LSPIKGIALNRFVITVAPQKLICPQTNTYPKKAVAIINPKIAIPLNHKIKLRYDLKYKARAICI